jgi:hypothetical protein
MLGGLAIYLVVWQSDRKSGSFAEFASGSYLTALNFNEFSHQRQPYSHSLVFSLS